MEIITKDSKTIDKLTGQKMSFLLESLCSFSNLFSFSLESAVSEMIRGYSQKKFAMQEGLIGTYTVRKYDGTYATYCDGIFSDREDKASLAHGIATGRISVVIMPEGSTLPESKFINYSIKTL